VPEVGRLTTPMASKREPLPAPPDSDLCTDLWLRLTGCLYVVGCLLQSELSSQPTTSHEYGEKHFHRSNSKRVCEQSNNSHEHERSMLIRVNIVDSRSYWNVSRFSDQAEDGDTLSSYKKSRLPDKGSSSFGIIVIVHITALAVLAMTKHCPPLMSA
jgi:hypothetical protein